MRSDLLRAGLTPVTQQHAGRVAWLDAASWVETCLAEALANAEHSIWWIGLGLRGTSTVADPMQPGARITLAELVSRRLKEAPRLEMHVLEWVDPALATGAGKNASAALLDWPRHGRLQLELDCEHPLGARHHQHLAVIDDSLAFVGGGALVAVLDGEVAASVSAVCRDRWWRATGERVPAATSRRDAWPAGLAPQCTDTQVVLARTSPDDGLDAEVLEVEALWLTSIAAAEQLIAIEAKHLSSRRILEALAARLAEPHGPRIELLLLAPSKEALALLQSHDHHGRLHVQQAVGARNGAGALLVVDDALLKLGSSTPTNRAMRVDTECDVAILAPEGPGTTRAFEALRRQRMLDSDSCARAAPGAPLALDPGAPAQLPAQLVDPETPQELAAALAREGPRTTTHADLLRSALLVGGLASLAALWRWTPLGEALALERLAAIGASLPGVLAPLLVCLVFVIGGLCVIPVMLLILQTALVFGPGWGLAYSALGVVAGTSATYLAGRLLGRGLTRRLLGTRGRAVAMLLRRGGILTIAFVRVLPLGPFTIVNVAAGALRVPFRRFLPGTLLGLGPSAVPMALLGGSLVDVAREATLIHVVLLGGAVLALGTAMWLAREHLRHRVLDFWLAAKR